MKKNRKAEQFHTIVIGGGASGMAAALASSETGNPILLLEKQDCLGRKLLATGNGRCNLTNLDQRPEYYRSDHPDTARKILSSFGAEETIRLFGRVGIQTRQKDGYVYPYSEMAAPVRYLFERAVEMRKNIRVITEEEVRQVQPVGRYVEADGQICGRYLVKTSRKQYLGDHVIISTGGLAGPEFGCSGDGYRLAEELGHSLITPLPALTALRSPAPFLKKLKGVRIKAAICLIVDQEPVYRDQGELQWTAGGISGIVVFQASRFASVALHEGKTVELVIDFMPEYPHEEVCRLLTAIEEEEKDFQLLKYRMAGIFPRKIVPVLIREAGLSEDRPVHTLSKDQMNGLAHVIKAFPLRINGVTGYEKAQVTRGGIPLSELDENLQSKKWPGIYFTGEVVDVDGICGGYNLQWAWASGTTAGKAASYDDVRRYIY